MYIWSSRAEITRKTNSTGSMSRLTVGGFATKTLSTGANGQKADGTSPLTRVSSCSGVDRYHLTTMTAFQNCADPALGKHGHVTTSLLISRPTPTLPDAHLRYQDALDWRKWTKGAGMGIPLLSAQF